MSGESDPITNRVDYRIEVGRSESLDGEQDRENEHDPTSCQTDWAQRASL